MHRREECGGNRGERCCSFLFYFSSFFLLSFVEFKEDKDSTLAIASSPVLFCICVLRTTTVITLMRVTIIRRRVDGLASDRNEQYVFKLSLSSLVGKRSRNDAAVGTISALLSEKSRNKLRRRLRRRSHGRRSYCCTLYAHRYRYRRF